jgi:hypothetical protein
MLQVIFTQAAIFRTAVLDFGRKPVRHRAGLRVRERLCVVFRVARNLDFEEAVFRTLLLHPHFVVAQDDVRVDQFLARWTDGARIRKECGVAVSLWRRTRQELFELDHDSHSFGMDEECGGF